MSLPRLHSQRRSPVSLLRSRRPCVPSPASGPHLWSQGKVLSSLWACRMAAASVACRCTFLRVASGFFFFFRSANIIFLWFCCFVSGVLHCGGLYGGYGNVEFDVVSGVICFCRYGRQRETRSSRPCPTCRHWPMTKSPSRLTTCSRRTWSLALNSTW